MTVGINCGHTASGAGSGAVGIIKESEHTRLVGQALMSLLRSAGVTVIDCTIDQANTQQEYLAAAVALANMRDLDWFISIHFNASKSHEGHGVEVYTYEGRQYQDAVDVCANIADLGFKNRGVKAGSGLYVIRKTKAKSMLIEVCFCDNVTDVDTYLAVGGSKAVAKAICDALLNHITVPDVVTGETAIMGTSVATAEQLNGHLLSVNPRLQDICILHQSISMRAQKRACAVMARFVKH